MSLNFDNGVTKELKWSSIVWNAAPSGPLTVSGATSDAPVANGQLIASTSNPALPVPTQPRPQAPPAAPKGATAQRPFHSNHGSGSSPQRPSKTPRGYGAHPYYSQPYPHSHPPPGGPYAGHPYPTPSSSSNNTPSRNINFMHYQPPPPAKPTVNAYYRPRPALDAEARMQMAQYPPAHGPQHLPSSRAPPSPVSPTRDSSTRPPGDAPLPMKPAASKNESQGTNQLPIPQQSEDTPP